MPEESVYRPETSRHHLPITSCNPGKLLGKDGATSPTAGPGQSAVREGAVWGGIAR